MPEDAPAVAQVLRESFAEYEVLYTVEGFSATTPSADQVLTRMQDGPVWVAFRHAEVLGTVSAVVKGKSLYVRGMAVLPAARGSRVGAALLDHVEHWASSAGCSKMFLSTTPFLSSAIRLYERFGFRRVEEGPQNLFGTPLFTMEKNLSRM